MGGHGGLNILPQKKWNVYNHDNRAIVEKDKKQAQAKKRAKYQKDREDQLAGKIQVLRQQQGGEEKQGKQTKYDTLASSLNQEFKKLNETTHINLFQREQKIIENKQILEMKKLQQAEFLKDKNMDYSSKFLGTYADGNKKCPWYVREKGYAQARRRPAQIEQLLSVKKSDSHTINQVIKIEKNSHKHQQSRDQSSERERSREKKRIKEQPKSCLQILREKRLKRQQKQRQKALKLKALKNML